jgi:hypothetical protein
MASKKDMRRSDLGTLVSHLQNSSVVNGSSLSVIPYQLPVAKENASDMGSTLGSTLPMAAMFTRNKYIGWCVGSGGAGKDGS